ncbi:hypothetical protein MNBD_GAMMA12-3134 [hydrothermal vent metagenome]|uniref:DUF5063 domain-containing protein n=1 Tax=hydrothermal vent metagenome TaxID=652676 RepID=A0A3B0Z068_9ZZZZ
MSDNLLGLNVFIDSARHLCAWLEGPPMDPVHGVNTALKLLSNIHSEAMLLPVSDDMKDDINAPTVCEDHIQSMKVRLADFPLKRFDLNNPCDSTVELKSFNIYSTFALILPYIKNGLDYYEQGQRETALNYWQKGFYYHWGTLVAGFIFALQSYINSESTAP